MAGCSSASAFNLQHVVFIETCEEKMILYRYVDGKERSPLVAFSNDQGCSLVLQENLSSGVFLKVSCKVESEAILKKFVLCYIKICWCILHL